MEQKQIIIFTDGSCLKNPGPGGWAAIVASEEVKEFGGHEAHTTNNRMELFAALQALQNCPKNSSIKLYTDSNYLVNGMTQWISGWQRKQWQTQNGTEVQNRDLWEQLAIQKSQKQIQWQHIPAHSDIDANERCDQIALKFAQKESVNLYEGPSSDYQVSLKLPNSTQLQQKKKSRSQRKKAGIYLSYVQGELHRDETWSTCEARVKGVTGAKFKKCCSEEEENETLIKWGLK